MYKNGRLILQNFGEMIYYILYTLSEKYKKVGMVMPNLQCEKIHFPSANGKNTVAGYLYTMPDVAPRAVLQISHGMCEYIERYRPMAEFYAAQGIVVAGNDHLGHGATSDPKDYGHYGEKDGRRHVLNDLHSMNTLLHNRYPTLPVILYGHSMGSFYARWYAETWPESIKALILSGTAGPSPVNVLGKMLAGFLAKIRGPRAVSQMLVQLSFGQYCKKIENPVSPNAWISRDEAVVRAYDADARCIFPFTAGTYREMLTVLCHVNTRDWARSIPKDLPILLIAGDGDPVGNYGAGVREVWAMLGDAGVQDLTCQIWEGGRHEMHNETNRQEVFEYCLTWIEDHIEPMR